jgi:CRISPR-associated protein Csm1
VTLGAIFHDIGKFYQRAERVERVGKIEKDKHQEFSARFLEENKEKVIRLFELDEDSFDILVSYVRRHHERFSKKNAIENTLSHLLIQKADHLSSGLDDEEEFFEEKNLGDDREIYKTLIPDFCFIRPGSYLTELKDERNFGYEFKSLSKKIKPISHSESSYSFEKRKMDYEELWKGFLNDFKKLPEKGDFNFKYEALRSLFFKYMWCIPSYTYADNKVAIPDVSLAHHLFTTAAIATSLEAFERATEFEYLDDSTYEKFIFLSVDFSGIQKFIFRPPKETKKWAAKILRARSLAVSLALETVVRMFIEEFGVNISVLLMNAGGKAWLLLPNLPSSTEKIKKIRAEVVNRLLEDPFYGEVKLKISYVFMNEEDFKVGKFKEKLKELFKEESENRFKLFEISEFEKFIFKNYSGKVSASEDKSPCPVCGVSPKEGELCRLCERLKEIGEKLPKSSFLKVFYGSKGNLPDLFPIPDIKPVEKANNERLRNGEAIYSFSIEDFEGYPVKFMENYVPVIENENGALAELIKKECYEPDNPWEEKKPKNFCHIAFESLEKEENSFYGRPYLAVLKADVDKLGFILSEGFVKLSRENDISILSLSRLVSLSSMLDFFFTEIVKDMAKDKEIYSVFSGGDDLFLIGPWYKVLRFEGELRQKFKEYTCNNENLTISVGIEVVKPTLPVYTMAELGEGALKKAKDTRNSTVVFGRRINYSKFSLGELLKVADELLDYLKESDDERKISISFLYKALKLSQMANEETENVKNLLWRAYLNYLVVRNVKSEDFASEVLKKFEQWISKYSENTVEEEKKKKDDLFYIPVSIAIYRRRRYA